LYATPVTLLTISGFLGENFVKLAGIPKLAQHGFLQKLTSMPATAGGVGGSETGGLGAEEITSKEKSLASR
jgi:hypothetical protein